MGAPAPDAPRVRVAALLELDGRIVLVRHRSGARRYHLLPGGGVGWGETLEEALVREVREETGLEAAIGQPLFISDTIDPTGRRHVVNLTFAAKVTGGSVTEKPDDPRVEAVDLIAPESLCELDLRPPMAEAISAAIAAGMPSVPTRYLGAIFAPERDASVT